MRSPISGAKPILQIFRLVAVGCPGILGFKEMGSLEKSLKF